MGGRFKPEFNARVREGAALQKGELKAALVRLLGARVKGLGLTQEQAASRLGLYQPEVSLLLKGPSTEFSVWKLLTRHANRFRMVANHAMQISCQEIATFASCNLRCKPS